MMDAETILKNLRDLNAKAGEKGMCGESKKKGRGRLSPLPGKAFYNPGRILYQAIDLNSNLLCNVSSTVWNSLRVGRDPK
jgi:hypothetical protein